VERLPLTSSTTDAGAPPSNVLRHVNASDVPFTSPSKSAGGEGGVGMFTKMRISLDAGLRPPSPVAWIRT